VTDAYSEVDRLGKGMDRVMEERSDCWEASLTDCLKEYGGKFSGKIYVPNSE